MCDFNGATIAEQAANRFSIDVDVAALCLPLVEQKPVTIRTGVVDLLIGWARPGTF
jgi:hypothetical protein